MSFRARLFSGFLLIALIAGITGFLGVYGSRRIESDFNKSTRAHAQVLRLGNDTITQWRDAVSNLDHYIIGLGAGIDNKATANAYRQTRDGANDSYDQLLRALPGDQKSDAMGWKASLDRAIELGDQTLKRLEQGENPAAASGDMANITVRTSEAEQALLSFIAVEGQQFQTSLANAQQATNSLMTLMLVLIGIALAVAVLFSYYISRAIARPITRLTEATSELSSGNLGITVEAASRDEIGTLAMSFNAMSEDLKESHEELTALTATLERRVADRTAELARSNAELEQFAYVASHDLQEPLRAVSSYAELLEMRYAENLDDRARKYIGHMVSGVERMQALINDLLTYSRIGTRGKEFVPTDINKVLDEALENLKESIKENQAVVIRDALPTAEVDGPQIRQLFQNLIGNAVKFHGEARPEVRVSAEREGVAWRFSVKDNGIGIEEKYASRIFEIFQRLHGRTEYPGTGIGLSICRRIVERHGGRIWVESEPGTGSTFYFTVPAEREDGNE
jgi:signal transduction histidine kinase